MPGAVAAVAEGGENVAPAVPDAAAQRREDALAKWEAGLH
jgi:hypothetical protein